MGVRKVKEEGSVKEKVGSGRGVPIPTWYLYYLIKVGYMICTHPINPPCFEKQQ